MTNLKILPIVNKGPKSGGLRRPCRDCGVMFFRDGKYQRLCRPCLDIAQSKIKLGLKKYWERVKQSKV